MAVVPASVAVPLYIQLGDGPREHLGDVTVALTAHTNVDQFDRLGVALAAVDPDLLTEQVAALLDHAAATLRKGRTTDAATC